MCTIIVLLCIGLLAHDVCADTTHLTPSKDNTLFEDAHGAFSNGAGAYLFAGTTHSGPLRRTLLAFDLSSISTDATITSVALTMQMTSNAHAVSLHNLQGDWGEGASDAVGEEGVGARTESGDATWTDAIADQAAWASPGGDFNPEASASLSISDLGIYIWTSTPQLVADVQGWVQDPVTNFGWILIGNESANGTAKRFNSSENSINRPVLTVKYIPAAGASPERTGSASLGAVKDNSLYEDDAGALSNGSGEFLFVGRTGQPKNRRALLAFEFSSVPPTAIITSAALTMHLSRTSPGGTQSIAVRKMRSDWDEDLFSSNAPAVSPNKTTSTKLSTSNAPTSFARSTSNISKPAPNV